MTEKSEEELTEESEEEPKDKGHDRDIRYLSQADEPKVATGKMLMWHDSANSRWLLIYGTAEGNKAVELG